MRVFETLSTQISGKCHPFEPTFYAGLCFDLWETSPPRKFVNTNTVTLSLCFQSESLTRSMMLQ